MGRLPFCVRVVELMSKIDCPGGDELASVEWTDYGNYLSYASSNAPRCLGCESYWSIRISNPNVGSNSLFISGSHSGHLWSMLFWTRHCLLFTGVLVCPSFYPPFPSGILRKAKSFGQLVVLLSSPSLFSPVLLQTTARHSECNSTFHSLEKKTD